MKQQCAQRLPPGNVVLRGIWPWARPPTNIDQRAVSHIACVLGTGAWVAGFGELTFWSWSLHVDPTVSHYTRYE